MISDMFFVRYGASAIDRCLHKVRFMCKLVWCEGELVNGVIYTTTDCIGMHQIQYQASGKRENIQGTVRRKKIKH